MFRRKISRETVRFLVDEEADRSLSIQRDRFPAVFGSRCEAHATEQVVQEFGIRRRELNELETVDTHRILVLCFRRTCHDYFL